MESRPVWERELVWGHELESDDQLKVEATRALERELTIARDEIKVAVAGGWITLTGNVVRPYQRAQAERIVRRVPGVKRVINSIAIEDRPVAVGVRRSHGLWYLRNTARRPSRSPQVPR